MKWWLRFCRGKELKFLSHLELMRLWERAMIRAGVPLAYSQGFSPHPRLSLACPLPVGVTAEGELLEVHLKEAADPRAFQERITQQLPLGIVLKAVEPVAESVPALASQVRWLYYRLSGQGQEVADRLASFLALQELPWEEVGRKQPRRYNLRQHVADIRMDSNGNLVTLE
ncbi:MAG: TIGR03936 family radical SAM-associated protein, partial [Chloroflexota bacterium]